MRFENLYAQDPRRVLCERKYFGMRPQPLEQHLYSLNLSQCAERVFWLHWDAGYLRGDFTSEIAISEVARRVRANSSTVTRAYQALREHGLIRRQDPGRDPSRPFCQATAVTEVLLPRDALPALLGSPERMVPAGKMQTDGATLVRRHADSSTQVNASTPQPDLVKDKQQEQLEALRAKFSGRASQTVFAKLSDDERADLFNAQRLAQAGQPQAWQPASDTRLDTGEILWLRDYLARYANESKQRPASEMPAKGAACAKPGIRRICTFSLAYLRKQLTQHLTAGEVDEKYREIVWAAEEGALMKFEPRLAINIALKKLKEGVWTRPNRMPPNWRRAVA